MAKSLRKIVDELGYVRGEIEKLTAREQRLKSFVASQGDGEYDGVDFSALVFASEREVIVPEKVREILSPKMLKKVSRVQEIVTVRTTEI